MSKEGWIKITRKKPEPGVCVLVCGDGDGNVFAAFYAGRGRWLAWVPDDMPIEHTTRVLTLPFKPTHWQPAPRAIDSSEGK